MSAQAQRIKYEFIITLGLRENDGILGWHFYDPDLIDVTGTEFKGARLFEWGICASPTYSPEISPGRHFIWIQR